MTIYFDMDGTLADFYGVENWLAYLEAKDPYPYKAAKPLVHLATLARYLHQLQATGWKIGIISWLSKSGNESYNEAVTNAKLEWLAKHLPSVKWDEIEIAKFGTPKSSLAKDIGILFDDEMPNRNEWYESKKGVGSDEETIMDVLKYLKNF